MQNLKKLDEKFFKNSFFNICSENYITHLDDYITEKLFFACITGNIPIYYGKMNDIDKSIFNINRIIFYDPKDENSLNKTFNFINELLNDPIKLYNYYIQDIFLKDACVIINNCKINLNMKINEFIKSIS